MKALTRFLRTVVTGVVFLGALGPWLRAGDAASQSGFQTGTLVPVAAAVIVPANSPIFPPGPRTVGELSGSEFVAAPSAEQRIGHDARWRRQWAVSLAPLFASEALDAAGSYGMRELNPLLAGSNGGFGMRATTLKFGVVGALAGAEYFVVRKRPASAKIFTLVNWVTAGATTGLAVHNFGLH